MPRKTDTTHIKWERALRLTVQQDLTKNWRYIFTDCYRKSSWYEMDRCNSQKQLDSSQWIVDHFMSICWI